jgi:hypothetical protein
MINIGARPIGSNALIGKVTDVKIVGPYGGMKYEEEK